MINTSIWFSSQLASSAEGLGWAIKQIPAERQTCRPPKELGEWSAARHLFHLWFYEQTIALPSMRQWWGGAMPAVRDGDEDNAWKGTGELIEILLNRFVEIRNQQITLLPDVDPTDWDRAIDTIWGSVSLWWVVAKTYQHTAEHISDVLRIALFWEFAAAREKLSNEQ